MKPNKILFLSLLTSLVLISSIALFSFEAVNILYTEQLSPHTKLIIQKGDITHTPVDAIVNAANEQLEGGAGACGAIFKAAGWQQLQNACNQQPLLRGIRCPVGQAYMTTSFDLKFKHGIKRIIHAVGPDCRIIKDPAQQDMLLESAYKNSLTLADKNGLQSIAFPFISSGIYGFPQERAVKIALQTIKEYAAQYPTTSLTEVYMVLFSQQDAELFVKAVKNLSKHGV